MKTILGLDLGYSCGWALRAPDGAWRSGTWDLTASGKEPGQRLAALGYELLTCDSKNPPDLIAFEHVRHPSSGILAAHAWGALWGVVMEFCWRSSVPYLGLSPAEVAVKTLAPSAVPRVAVVVA